MRYCRNCGKMLDDSETVCPICGTPVPAGGKAGRRKVASQHIPEQTDDPYKKQKRKQFRKSMNWCGLIGFILALLSSVASMFFCVTSIVAYILCFIGEKRRVKYPVCTNLAVIGKFFSLITFIFWALILIVLGACFGSDIISACS
ncbi:MAG: zinc-ribbon domain-containing protein [Clostridia bacterium]|nr:zinc-ribbon domain-containing protein [Clostridia bacterium]